MSLHWSLSIQIRYRFIHTYDSKSKCQLSKSSPYLSALHIPTCTIITIIIIIRVFENQGSLVSLHLQLQGALMSLSVSSLGWWILSTLAFEFVQKSDPAFSEARKIVDPRAADLSPPYVSTRLDQQRRDNVCYKSPGLVGFLAAISHFSLLHTSAPPLGMPDNRSVPTSWHFPFGKSALCVSLLQQYIPETGRGWMTKLSYKYINLDFRFFSSMTSDAMHILLSGCPHFVSRFKGNGFTPPHNICWVSCVCVALSCVYQVDAICDNWALGWVEIQKLAYIVT